MAATQVSFARTGVDNADGPLANFYDKTVDEVLKRSDEVPIQGGALFTEKQADTLTYRSFDAGNTLGLPGQVDDTDPQQFDQAPGGYALSHTLLTYQRAVVITRTLLKIDKTGGMVRDRLTGLPNAGKRWLEYSFADQINNGTTNIGADGSALFANDHYLSDPSSGLQWSNLDAPADLSTTSANTMIVNMRKRKGERGDVMPIMLQRFYIPSDLIQTAKAMKSSDLQPETSTNRANVWKDYEFRTWDYLTDTDAWLGEGDLPESEWGLFVAWLTRPEVTSLGYPSPDYPNLRSGFYLYMQAVVGAHIVKNLHLNQGAA